MGALIDTSVLIACERGELDLDALLEAHPDESWALSAVTASELLHGVMRATSTSQRNLRLEFAEDKLRKFPVYAFDLSAARVHATLWAGLARRGRIVGERDLMIAATAMAIHYGVATRDLRSFPNIPGLKVLRL